jgi:hypothetical protein
LKKKIYFYHCINIYKMKYLISFLLAITCNSIYAQNVGIGLTNPSERLDVNGAIRSAGIKLTSSNVLELGSNVIGKETNAGKIGYSVYTANVVDFVGGGTTVNQRKIKFWAEGGSIFEGGASFVGNLTLASSDLGVKLNGADNAMITRGFDLFSSGKHNTLGRWGIFMEPNRLTLGVPNLAGKGFSFSKYNSNSTSEEVLSVASDDGAVRRPATGTANLLPIAMGVTDFGGGAVTGTGNFSVQTFAQEEGKVLISVDNFTFTNTNHIAVVTCRIFANPNEQNQAYATTAVEDGKLAVYTYFGNHDNYTRGFHFVIYKLN